jgi:hypothetical protein
MKKSLAKVVATGSRLDSLRALRDYLADALDNTESARDQASLSARLTDVLAQIEDLTPPTEEVDPLADLVPDEA